MGSSRRFVGELQASLEQQNNLITDVSDLAEQGIDIATGVLLGIYDLQDKDPHTVIVVGIEDRDAFEAFLEKVLEVEILEVEEPIADTPSPIYLLGDSYLVYPEARLAVVASSAEILRRSLENRAANLAYARENDRLYSKIRDYLSRPLLRGPGFFFRIRDLPSGAVRDVVGVLRLERSAIRVNAELELVTGGIKVLEEMLAPPPPALRWEHLFGVDVALVIVVEDDALPRYLRFLSSTEGAGRFMARHYGGLLHKLQHVSSLERLALAATGYRDGIPDFIMGLWGDAASLEEIFAELRVEFRDQRDRAVLVGALDAYTGDEPASLDVLMSQGLLLDEPYSRFDRYQIRFGRTFSSPSNGLTAEDFRNRLYEREHGDAVLRFLSPQLTKNDLRYRPEFEGLNEDALLDDRYRLSFVAKDGVFWVGTNVDDIEAFLAREVNGSSDLRDSEVFHAGARSWDGTEKLRIFANMDRIITLGLLSPERDIEEWVKKNLLDLRHHPAVTIGVSPLAGGDYLRVSVQLTHQSALE